mgnify:CR=1 FL=1
MKDKIIPFKLVKGNKPADPVEEQIDVPDFPAELNDFVREFVETNETPYSTIIFALEVVKAMWTESYFAELENLQEGD